MSCNVARSAMELESELGATHLLVLGDRMRGNAGYSECGVLTYRQ